MAGRRIYLKRNFTKRIFDKNWNFFSWPRTLLFLKGIAGQCNRPFQLVPISRPNAARKKQAKDWEKVQTCNLGVWKEDFYAVDGFDESYVGHGLEDSDFTLRLIRNGVQRKTAEHTSPVLHLYHSRSIPGRADRESLNPVRFQELLDSNRHLAVQGISRRVS